MSVEDNDEAEAVCKRRQMTFVLWSESFTCDLLVRAIFTFIEPLSTPRFSSQPNLMFVRSQQEDAIDITPNPLLYRPVGLSNLLVK